MPCKKKRFDGAYQVTSHSVRMWVSDPRDDEEEARLAHDTKEKRILKAQVLREKKMQNFLETPRTMEMSATSDISAIDASQEEIEQKRIEDYRRMFSKENPRGETGQIISAADSCLTHDGVATISSTGAFSSNISSSAEGGVASSNMTENTSVPEATAVQTFPTASSSVSRPLGGTVAMFTTAPSSFHQNKRVESNKRKFDQVLQSNQDHQVGPVQLRSKTQPFHPQVHLAGRVKAEPPRTPHVAHNRDSVALQAREVQLNALAQTQVTLERDNKILWELADVLIEEKLALQGKMKVMEWKAARGAAVGGFHAEDDWLGKLEERERGLAEKLGVQFL